MRLTLPERQAPLSGAALRKLTVRHVPFLMTVGITAYLVVAIFVLKLRPELALLAPIAAGLAIVGVLRTDLAFLALVAVLSADTVLGASDILTATKFLGLLVTGSWLLRILLWRDLEVPRSPLLLGPPLFLVWAALCLSAAESLVFGVAKLATIVQLNLLVILTATLIRRREDLRRVIWVLLVSNLLSAVYGIQQYFAGAQAGELVGLTTNRNAVSLFMAMCAPLIFYLFPRVGVVGKLGLAASGGLVVLAQVFTFSRGGFLAMLVALTLSVAFANRAARVRLAFLGLALVLVAIVFLPAHYADRISTIIPAVTRGTDTVGLRYQLWEIAEQMIRDHPWMGVGPGNYLRHFMRYGGVLGINRTPLIAHNALLGVAAELGIPGLLLFSVIFLSLLWEYIRLARASSRMGDSELRDLSVCFGVMVVVFLVGGMSGNVEYFKYLWLLLGLAAALRLIVRQHQAQLQDAATGGPA